MHRVVYIPIEKSARELRSKSLVAGTLVKRGIPVVIGFSEGLIAAKQEFPTGVYYFKGMNRVQAHNMANIKQFGHQVAVTDEESLNCCDGDYMIRDCWHDVARNIDKVFCNGEFQRSVLSRLRGFRDDQLAVTGNPRVDLLTPPFDQAMREKADAIREEHGRFILINTDTEIVTHPAVDLNGYWDLLVKIGWLNDDRPEDGAFINELIVQELSSVGTIVEFVRTMSRERPEVKLVLRPHPSESPEYWRTLAKSVDNLTIVERSDPLEWMLACDGLVHTGCTTGTEAAVLGVPVISIVRPLKSLGLSDVRLSNRVNTVVSTVDDAVRAVDLLAQGAGPFLDPSPETIAEKLAPFIKPSAPGHITYEAIADELLSMVDGGTPVSVDQLSPISGEIDQRLRRQVNRTSFADGAFDHESLGAALQASGVVLMGDGAPVIRDLNWGVYAVGP